MFKLVGLDLSLTHLSLAALLTRVIYMFLSVGVNVEVNVGRSQALAAMSSLGRGGISSIGIMSSRSTWCIWGRAFDNEMEFSVRVRFDPVWIRLDSMLLVRVDPSKPSDTAEE